MSNSTSNQNYYIYLNLHSSNPKTFSVMQKGLVIKNPAELKAYKAKFLVRKAGHNTAVKEQTRNVHAFVVCEPKHFQGLHYVDTYTLDKQPSDYFPVHYHYNDGAFFSISFNGENIPLDESYEFKYVLMQNHKCYLNKSVVYKYLLDKKVTVEYFMRVINPKLHKVFINSIQQLIQAHSENKLNEIEGFKYVEGICSNLHKIVQNNLSDPTTNNVEHHLGTEFQCILNYAFSKWEKYSGNVSFPIKASFDSGTKENACTYYNLQNNKWEGQHGLESIELLKHLEKVIKYL